MARDQSTTQQFISKKSSLYPSKAALDYPSATRNNNNQILKLFPDRLIKVSSFIDLLGSQFENNPEGRCT